MRGAGGEFNESRSARGSASGRWKGEMEAKTSKTVHRERLGNEEAEVAEKETQE